MGGGCVAGEAVGGGVWVVIIFILVKPLCSLAFVVDLAKLVQNGPPMTADDM